MKRPRVIGVGELLWDLLPTGRQLGGAPANFAYHAQALGADALVVSRVGTDLLGKEILEHCRTLGLRTDGIASDSTLPTGTVSVALDAHGTPAFTIHENVAWDAIQLNEAIVAEAARTDAICFGSLAQRNPVSRAAIRSALAAVPRMALRIFDINLRQQFWSREVIQESLELSNVLKLNDEELPVVAKLLGLTGNEQTQMRQLARRFKLKAMALTKGANGSSLLIGDELNSRPGSKLRIVDTVGAGDSYTAALALGLMAGHDSETILESAHRLADFVCTQPGATPALPADLVRLVRYSNQQ